MDEELYKSFGRTRNETLDKMRKLYDNTTAEKYVVDAPQYGYLRTVGDKELLKTIRILIKAFSSLASFIMELSNVLLMTRDQLQKIESALSEYLGEL